MTLADAIREMTGRLTVAGIPYMLTGSLASSFHGEPRATRDIDVVIDPSRPALRLFVEQLERDDYYVSADAAFEALDRRTEFNVIETRSGWKVDLMIRKDRPFSLVEFDRRQRADVLGTEAYVATAEDTIIAKLERAKAGDSERQLRDAAGIVSVLGPELDRGYLERWAEQLGLRDLWGRVRPAEGSGQ